MKKFKKLIPAMVMLLIATMLMGTTTYAWFSMNRTVTASSMSVKATSGSSLVISKSTNFTAGSVEVTNSVDITVMPSTKYETQTGEGGAALTASKDLVYVANPSEVDPNTGLKKAAGSALYYAAADTASTDGGTIGYYYDYIYYLAAEGAEDITSGALKITIEPTDAATTVTTPGTGTEQVLRAASVLVYVNDTLVTTSPIVIKDGANKQSLQALSSSVKIPKGAPGDVTGAMKVTLRLFIDGALEDETGVSTYVRNANVVNLTRELSFDCRFDVE